MRIEIVPSTLDHVFELAETMRAKDRLEAINGGENPKRALYKAYKSSLQRETVLVDGRVAAMSGVYGTVIGNTGMPYLVTSHVSEEVSPIRFAKIYLRQLQKMRSLFPVLENYVDATYDEAVRLLRIAGFTLTPFILNGNPFYKFRMTQ